MKITIDSLRLKGFKNHIEKFEMKFNKDFTSIIGDNGQGKTTVGEAITWILFGCNLNGNDKADSNLLNKSSKVMWGELQITIDEQKYTIVREKKGSNTTILINNRDVRQLDLLKMLPPKEIFMSIFNTSYFLGLGEKKRRDMLISILPPIPKESIIEKLDSPFKQILEQHEFLNSNVLLEEFRNEKREFENSLVYLEGQLDLKKEELVNLIIPDIVEFKEEDRLIELKNKLKKARNNIPKTIDVSLLQDKKAQLERELKMLNNEKPELVETTELEKDLARFNGQLELLESQLEKIAGLTGICPTCKQAVSEEHTEQMINSINEEIHYVNKEILIIEDALEDLNNYNSQLIAEHNKKIAERKAEIMREIAELNIEELVRENENILRKYNEEINKIEHEINELENIKRNIELQNYRREQAIKQKGEIETAINKIEKDIENAKQIVRELVIKIQAVEKYNAAYAKELAEIISVALDKVTINLHKIVKSTGELKDCFELYYEGKEYNLLSNSEKVKTGLEIANLLMYFSNYWIPIFLDNAESITVYNRPNTQLIEARVVKGALLETA